MDLPQITEEQKKLRGFDFWKALGNPKHICSPMVAQSELAFRLLVTKYGCDLCYTPMINSIVWNHIRKNNQKKGRIFKTCDEEKRVVAQLAGNDPQSLLEAAKDLQENYKNIVAFDINFGCPQNIARRGNYGSYLLSDTKLVCSIVETLAKGLDLPVFVKMRILDSDVNTIFLAQQFEKCGASALTVHGRTKEEKGHKQKHANWEIIRKIKENISIPLIANGGMYDYQDIERCFEETNCDAVMSAEALLEYPALFSKKDDVDLDKIALEYMEIANKPCNRPEQKELKAHLFKFFHRIIESNKECAQKLGFAKEFDDHIKVVNEFIEMRKDKTSKEKRGWYFRWWKGGYTRVNGIITPNNPVKMFDKDYLKGKNDGNNGNQQNKEKQQENTSNNIEKNNEINNKIEAEQENKQKEIEVQQN